MFLAIFTFLPIFICLASAPERTYVLHVCSDDSNYANDSAYGTNVKSMLSLISSNNLSGNGFYNISVGQNPDKVNSIGLCRGDISLRECQSCLNFSATDLYARCPTQREAIAWYDYCMLRYSNEFIFGTWDTVYYPLTNQFSLPNQDEFNQALRTLLPYLRDHATLGNSTRKFAVGYTNYTIFDRAYALVQCTPDLSGQLCGKCLDGAFNKLFSGVSVMRGGRVFSGSCSFRYETDQFYENTSDALVLQPAAHNGRQTVDTTAQSRQNTIRKVIIIVTSAVGSLALVTGVFTLVQLKWRKKKHEREGHHFFLMSDADEIKNVESLQFDFETIRAATNNFNSDSKLGQGGFGSVYKGKLVEGKEIAVKRLAAHSLQGDLEFKNEVVLMVQLQHRNLVRLLGFCLQGNERMLIYEFVANSSLDRILFDPLNRACLNWETRYKIIAGVARGLLYLHEDSRLRIIHRDLKAGNILLDEEMCPKIADFGMAKLFIPNQTQGDTNRIVGTYGYMAPEYAMHGKFSVKSDVYSFGILLLEIISGQKNSRFRVGDTTQVLTSFTWESWKAGTASSMIDPPILNGPRNEILRSIHIGLLCVQDSVAARPTMASVVLMLNSASLPLPLPTKPAYANSVESEMNITSGSRGRVGTSSIYEVSITDLQPR